MSKQQVKIKSSFAPCGTTVTDSDGKSLLEKITSIRFEHRVDEMPKLILEAYATETVIEGEMEVEQVTICPSCKKELNRQMAKLANDRKVRAAETTCISDEYRTYVSAPKEAAD